ncbi:MAG: hypothetical protein LUC23_01475, partial [Prevotellaceae bacterium]|nr:hypothetical protein [Prevotellaceae bacterium]
KMELSSDYFTVTPQVLEAVAGKVPATISGTFPEKFFKKNAVVEVTPVLKWDGGEARGESVQYQGEKVQGNAETISYKLGGTCTLKTSYDYVPEMAKSELYLEFKATVGKKEVAIPSVKVADGVIATSELIGQTIGTAHTANGDDAFERIIKEKYDANIMFLIQQANIRSSEMKTASEFNDQVKEIADTENKEITNIVVSAYASPDGGVKLNTGLAENRQDNTAKLVNKNLKKADVEATVDTEYTAQDWEGFQDLVSQSDIQDKELILRVLSMYSDPEQREQEIKNISSVYKTLADDVLPQLRRSRLTVNYDVIGKSDEEIAALAYSDASQLNLEELLYAATLTDDAAKQAEIYKKATELYPDDYRAFNNVGRLAFEAGDLDTAESYLQKSLAIQDSPEANLNMGLVELAKGDKEASETYLAKASGTDELNEALGNLYIAQGQYDRAVNAFGDVKTNSAALAQILAKDYNKANDTLDNVEKADATTAYLKAIVGARTNNSSMVMDNLKSAVAQDASLAQKAATDLEFSKYFTDSDFLAIVQ